jgi:hypothetical protein
VTKETAKKQRYYNAVLDLGGFHATRFFETDAQPPDLLFLIFTKIGKKSRFCLVFFCTGLSRWGQRGQYSRVRRVLGALALSFNDSIIQHQTGQRHKGGS